MIICIIGKSAAGKDTLVSHIRIDKKYNLKNLVPYTTRPKRTGETDGIEYHFVSIEQMNEMDARGEILERRKYDTVNGVWYYFTASTDIKDGENYYTIATPEAVRNIEKAYGSDKVKAIYVDVDDGQRLQRCIQREQRQDCPNYVEVCRRFVQDHNDFSEDVLGSISNLYRIRSDCGVPSFLKSWEMVYNDIINGGGD